VSPKKTTLKKLKCQQRLKVVAIAMGYWLVDRRPGSGRWQRPHWSCWRTGVTQKWL